MKYYSRVYEVRIYEVDADNKNQAYDLIMDPENGQVRELDHSIEQIEFINEDEV